MMLSRGRMAEEGHCERELYYTTMSEPTVNYMQ